MTLATRRIFLISACIAAGLCACAPAQPVATTTAPASPQEVRLLSRTLTDPARTPKAKAEAADALLSRGDSESNAVARDLLADNANRSAQVALVEAIARNGSSQAIFVEPLLMLLAGPDSAIREPAGRALAVMKAPEVTGRLHAIAADSARLKDVRLAAIAAIQRILDKEAVDALVKLLDDPDPAMAAAAADGLAKMTNIRSFGQDAAQWKNWWQRNKDKDRAQWLADLADSLAQAKSAMEADNARLRGRLTKTMTELYTATPAARRDALVLTYLKDPLREVRQMGLDLVKRSMDGGGTVSPEVQIQVRLMLGDTDELIRAESAKLLAALKEPEAVKLLLERAKDETSPVTREGILVALGQLSDREAIPMVLGDIGSPSMSVAAAAAGALAKIAATQPMDEASRAQATTVLVQRYHATPGGNQGQELVRAALLTAMGQVADKDFIPVCTEALSDVSATVRLAAVNSLARLNIEGSADAVAKLLNDPDRGVRGAVLTAMKSLGGTKNLPLLLKHTAEEEDAANRQQTWAVIMDLLAKADTATLKSVADQLADRPSAAAERIKIVQLYVAALRKDNRPELPTALRDLGRLQAAQSRQAEAAANIEEAYRLLSAANDPSTPEVWREWLSALLAGNDPSAAKVLADQKDAALTATGLAMLETRLTEMEKAGQWDSLAALTKESLRQLGDRLSRDQKDRLAKMQSQAEQRRDEDDRKRVSLLVVKLGSAEDDARKAAADELRAMSGRSVRPILLEMQTMLQADKLDEPLEKALLDVLKQVAPRLTGYDPAAAKPARLKTLATWLEGA